MRAARRACVATRSSSSNASGGRDRPVGRGELGECSIAPARAIRHRARSAERRLQALEPRDSAAAGAHRRPVRSTRRSRARSGRRRRGRPLRVSGGDSSAQRGARVRAARAEAAARRRRGRVRHVALQHACARRLSRRVGHRNRREQRLRVRVARRGEQRALVGALDDAAEVHHRDARRDVLDDREIVRDEQVRQPEARLQVARAG